MKKILMILVMLITLSFMAQGQIVEGVKALRTFTTDSIVGWKKGGKFASNISQTSLTNWAAGGENSIVVNGLMNLFSNFNSKKVIFNSTFDLGYGIIKQGKKKKIIKSDDNIDLRIKYGYQLYKKWYYATLLNFKTQFSAGYNYPNDSVPVSNFLAPGYVVGAVGVDYKPNKMINFFVSPLTVKTTIVNNQTLANNGAFGVDKAMYNQNGTLLKLGMKQRYEYGGFITAVYTISNFKTEFLKNIGLTSKLDLFSNYKQNPQNIDVNWEALLALTVNKYIIVNINTHLIYDDDISIAVDNNNDGIIDEKGARTQFKEMLGVGFTYKI